MGCPAFSPVAPGAGEASSVDAEVAAVEIGGATRSATTSSTKSAKAAAPVEDMTALGGERRVGKSKTVEPKQLFGPTA